MPVYHNVENMAENTVEDAVQNAVVNADNLSLSANPIHRNLWHKLFKRTAERDKFRYP